MPGPTIDFFRNANGTYDVQETNPLNPSNWKPTTKAPVENFTWEPIVSNNAVHSESTFVDTNKIVNAEEQVKIAQQMLDKTKVITLPSIEPKVTPPIAPITAPKLEILANDTESTSVAPNAALLDPNGAKKFLYNIEEEKLIKERRAYAEEHADEYQKRLGEVLPKGGVNIDLEKEGTIEHSSSDARFNVTSNEQFMYPQLSGELAKSQVNFTNGVIANAVASFGGMELMEYLHHGSHVANIGTSLLTNGSTGVLGEYVTEEGLLELGKSKAVRAFTKFGFKRAVAGYENTEEIEELSELYHEKREEGEEEE